MDGGDHRRGVFAAEHVFAAVFERDQEAVGGFAVVGEVAADVALAEPAPVAEEPAAATDSALAQGRRTESDIGNLAKRYCLDFQ